MASSKKIQKPTTPEEYLNKHSKLAYSYVHRNNINIPGYEKEDLFQVALLGLWKACLNFDPTRKFAFSTFAVNCIRNEINMVIRSHNTKSNGLEVESLEALAEQSLEAGMSADFFSPSVEDGTEDKIEIMDVLNFDLTDKEKIILGLREYMTEGEISRLYNISKWDLRKIRMKAREQRGA